MKSNIILSAVGEISDELIAAAEPGRKERAQARNTNEKTSKKKKIIAWSLSAAAALALIVTGAILLSVLGTGKLGPLTAYDYGFSFSADMMDGETNAYQRVYRFTEELKAWGPIPDTETVSVCRVMRNDDQKKHAASMADSIASVWELLYGIRPEVNTTVQTASRKNFLKDEVTFEVNPGEGYQIVTSGSSYANADSCVLSFALRGEADGKSVSLPPERLVPDADERFAAVQTEDDARAQFADLIAALQTAAGERFSVVSVRLAKLTTTTPTSRVTEIVGVTITLSDPAMNAEADPEGSSPTFGSDTFTVSLQPEGNGGMTASASASYVTVKYVKTEEKRMSLERAEELLAKNCVFSGFGGCPTCQAEQEKISFDGYDAVRLEYRKQNGSATLPVYAFYKLLEKVEPSELQAPSVYGKDLYAVTCVPAVDVEGIEEYFEELHRYGSVVALKFAHENADLEIDCLDPLSSLGIDADLTPGGACENDQYFVYESLEEFGYEEQVPMFHCFLQPTDGAQPEESTDELEKAVDAFWAALDDAGYSVSDFGGRSQWKILRKGTRRYLIKAAMQKRNTATREERAQGIDKSEIYAVDIAFTRLDKLPELDAKVRLAKVVSRFLPKEEEEE